jgi:hypothetical protein
MILEMIENILVAPETNIYEKSNALHELSLKRIYFSSPTQLVKIISVLANIIDSDPSPEVRAAALDIMKRIISLELEAETEQGKPIIDLFAVNTILQESERQIEIDANKSIARENKENAEEIARHEEVLRILLLLILLDAGPASPDVDELLLLFFLVAGPDPPPQGMLLLLILFLVLLDAESDIQSKIIINTIDITRSISTSSYSQEKWKPNDIKIHMLGDNTQPPIMKFLGSVTNAENEEHIRVLANRIVAKIEDQMSQKLLSSPEFTPTEG